MRLLPALCLALTLPAAAQDIRRLDGSHLSTAEVESFARKILAEAHVTGAQIAVLDRGRPVWSASYGLRRRDPDTPMDRNSITWAASITKSVFATYVMQLVERGEFNLDLPIAKQLPKPLNTYEPYRTSASEIVNDGAWPLVTPRMLLAHISGLANFASFEPDKKMHLHYKPGTQFLYSGEGINLVQFVIEQQKQKPLDELMQQAIFTPLHMDHTSLVYRKEFGVDAADRFDASGKFIAKTRRFPARAAGSMTTNADDLALFASALFGGRLLKPATLRAMLTPMKQIPTLHQFPLALAEPPGTEAKTTGLAYGIGWGLLTHTRFGPAFFKEGHGDGAQNYMICFTRHQTCMVLLTNSDNGENTFRPLLEHILGDTVTPWEWEGYTPSYIAASRKNQ